MRDRMKSWGTFFGIIGWVCVIGGIVAAFFTMGVALVIVPVGLGCLLTCAALEWMDGVTEELQAIKESSAQCASSLEQISGYLKRAEQDRNSAETASASQAARRRADVDRETEAPSGAQAVESFVAESQPGKYDAQAEADIYRRSQHRK